MKNILAIILLLPLLSMGQSYFQKNYDFSGGWDEGYGILKEGSDFILYGSGFDTLGKGGIRLIKVDADGKVLFKKVHTSQYGLGDGVNIIRYGDSLITGGTIFLKHNGQYARHAMLFFMSPAGDSLGILTYGDSLTTYHYRYIAQTPESGVIALGYNYISQGGVDGDQKMILVKYDKYFAVEWTREVASGGSFTGPNTVAVVEGSIYVGAYILNKSRLPLRRYYTHLRKYSLDGTLLINKNYDSQNGMDGAYVYPAKDGVFLTTILDSGTVNPRPMLYSYMAKLDTNLDIVWKTEIKIPDAAVNFIPKEQADGAILASGIYMEKEFAEYTSSRGYLAKYDSVGTPLWDRTYAGPTWADKNSFSTFIRDSADIFVIGICRDGNSQSEVSTNFWLVRTDSNGCVSPTNCTGISVPEIETEASYELEVYPQPAGKLLKINLQSDEGDNIQKLTISSVDGKEMFNQKFSERDVNSTEVDVENWPRGIYFLSISADSGQLISRKILVE